MLQMTWINPSYFINLKSKKDKIYKLVDTS